jgi:hypothetical protein
VQVSYKHSWALYQCIPYSTPRLDISHCFSIYLLLRLPLLRKRNKNKTLKNPTNRTTLKPHTSTTNRKPRPPHDSFLSTNWRNQTKPKGWISKKKKERKRPKNLRYMLSYNCVWTKTRNLSIDFREGKD